MDDEPTEDTTTKPGTFGAATEAKDFRSFASSLKRREGQGEREGASGARSLDYVRGWSLNAAEVQGWKQDVRERFRLFPLRFHSVPSVSGTFPNWFPEKAFVSGFLA
jgi:hypothetical protein